MNKPPGREEQEQAKRMHSGIWEKILHVGDISGKLLTLIALPSAIAAIFAYYDEIR